MKTQSRPQSNPVPVGDLFNDASASGRSVRSGRSGGSQNRAISAAALESAMESVALLPETTASTGPAQRSTRSLSRAEQEIQALLDALPPSRRHNPMDQEDGSDGVDYSADEDSSIRSDLQKRLSCNSSDHRRDLALDEEDGFTLTSEQFKAGIRLAIDDTNGLILACPRCGKRRLVTFVEATAEPSSRRLSKRVQTVCAGALGPEPDCRFYELAQTVKTVKTNGKGSANR